LFEVARLFYKFGETLHNPVNRNDWKQTWN